MAEEKVKKGWYRHFKGGIYRVWGVAKHTETDERYVIYFHRYDENPGGINARPLEMFTGYKVLPDGKKVKRFEYLGPQKPSQQ